VHDLIAWADAAGAAADAVVQERLAATVPEYRVDRREEAAPSAKASQSAPA
jgi:hypothetical protein